jgi:N-acetylmuramoyl-L-alanine amidase
MAAGVRTVRRDSPDYGGDFVREMESVGRSIREPAARLRYLRETLARRERERADELRRLRAQPPPKGLRRWAPRLLGPAGEGASGATRAARKLALATSAAVVAVAAFFVTTGLESRARLPEANASTSASKLRPRAAEGLLALPEGVRPKAVWLVEKGKDYELWSNGLRIDTSFAVEGPPRYFREFRRGLGLESEVHTKPVGILFHTTESDIWPLDASHNEHLRESSHALLRYLQREKAYHYLIDRFGQVHRVVDEDAKANHAGNAAWSSGDRLFLSLNNSFVGVAFETRWEGGKALPITEAQLLSGRSLTDYLRLRYDIPADMCVTHGIASLNAEKHLIGYHLDWARGFPFAAFGLPDQYAHVSPGVADFGFGYDETLTSVLGEPWAGVKQAERDLAAEARRRGVDEKVLRQEKQALYDAWRAEQLRDEQVARAASASLQATKLSGG